MNHPIITHRFFVVTALDLKKDDDECNTHIKNLSRSMPIRNIRRGEV